VGFKPNEGARVPKKIKREEKSETEGEKVTIKGKERRNKAECSEGEQHNNNSRVGKREGRPRE